MPIIKSAKKAARQAVKHTEHNKQIKKSIKTALKTFKADPTAENMRKAQSEYDKAAKKGLIKKNTASRRKAALAKFGKEHGVKLTAAEKSAKKPAETAKKSAEKAEKPAKTAAKTTKSAKKPTTKKTTTKKA